MNVLTFGVMIAIISLFLISIAPVFSESINTIDAEHPDIDDNAMGLMRTYPFLIFIGVILLMCFFWWRGGYD